MISLMLDHAGLLRTGRVKLLQAHAPALAAQIGISARVQMMPAASQGVIVGGMPTEHDQVSDHEGSATMQRHENAFEIRCVDVDLNHLAML